MTRKIPVRIVVRGYAEIPANDKHGLPKGSNISVLGVGPDEENEDDWTVIDESCYEEPGSDYDGDQEYVILDLGALKQMHPNVQRIRVATNF